MHQNELQHSFAHHPVPVSFSAYEHAKNWKGLNRSVWQGKMKF